MTSPEDPLFPAASWKPRPRPQSPPQHLSIPRRDEAALGAAPPAGGPQILEHHDGAALVRFRHHAPSARAVALQANGFWTPQPADGLDLREVGEGWWEAVIEVPADWRATYGFVEHCGDGPPPWWHSGLKSPGCEVVPDAGAPRSHAAGRGGRRSVVTVPEDSPFTPGLPPTPSDPAVHLLAPTPDAPRTWWWASRPGDPGAEELAAGTALPLLLVTDGREHVEQLRTPALLRDGVAAGVLPPLAAVFLDSGPARAEVLGVPGGHARFLAEQLVPRLRRTGLPAPSGPVTVTTEASRTVVTGSSFGGLTALFAVARAPELLGAAIAQSVSLWRYSEGALVSPLRGAATAHPLRLRLQAGRFEGSMAAQSGALAEALRRDGADVTLTVHSGGHDWAWWQPMMLQELSALLR